MIVDEKKLLREKDELLAKIADIEETIQLLRQKTEIESRASALKAEQIQQATVETATKERTLCPICNHPEKIIIEELIKTMKKTEGTTKIIREKYPTIAPGKIYQHIQHMEV